MHHPPGQTGQNLSAVFADTLMHKTVRDIIEYYSTNKLDIRAFALNDLTLQSGNNILDLGCGFGFFTRSLKGKIPINATVLGIDRIPEYRSLFLETCGDIGIKGEFDGSGIDSVQSLPSNAYDLILCSYAIYFFPEIVPEVARILKPEGIFVMITHSDGHAKECIDLLKETFLQSEIQPPASFPHEVLIARFDNKNGHNLLSQWFSEITEKAYTSSLLFNKGDFDDLKLYFEFKKPYYLPKIDDVGNMIFKTAISKIETNLQKGIPYRITKNDTIFVCRNPLNKK